MRLNVYPDLSHLLFPGMWVIIFVFLILVGFESWQQYQKIRDIASADDLQVDVTATKKVPRHITLNGPKQLMFGEEAKEITIFNVTPYKVKGIFVSPGGQFSTAIMDINGTKDLLVGIGDTLPDNKGRVVGIHPDRVIVEFQGRSEAVPLIKAEETTFGGVITKPRFSREPSRSTRSVTPYR